MKVTLNESNVKKIPRFQIGDYFRRTTDDFIRQIVHAEGGHPVLINPLNGELAYGNKEELSLNALMQNYVKNNGAVEKLNSIELILGKTGEILE